MALYTSATNVGGILPEDWGPLVTEPLSQMSLAMNPLVATQVQTLAHTFHIPVVTQDATAAWVTEGSEITPTDPTIAEINVTPSKLGALTIVSSELANDSNPQAAELVGMSMARNVARRMDEAFFGSLAAPAPAGLGSVAVSNRVVTDGATTASSTTVTSATAAFQALDVGASISGGSIPAGTTIVSVTNATTVVVSAAATATATGVTLTIVRTAGLNRVVAGVSPSNLDAFATAITQVQNDGGDVTAFCANPTDALAIQTMKSGSSFNTPLLGSDASNGTKRQILGVPLLVSPQVPQGNVWAVDNDRTFCVLRQDVSVAVDASVFFTSDRIAVRTTVRVGFAFAAPKSISKVAFAAS